MKIQETHMERPKEFLEKVELAMQAITNAQHVILHDPESDMVDSFYLQLENVYDALEDIHETMRLNGVPQ